MTANEGLAACPFCGGEAAWVEDTGAIGKPFGLVVNHALGCMMAGLTDFDRTAIIAAWNTRTPAPIAAGPSREAVERAVQFMRHDGLCGIVGGYGSCTCGRDEAEAALIAITSALRDAEARGMERAAVIAENVSFGTEIGEWLRMTKQEVSARSCHETAAAIRSAALTGDHQGKR